ncbi:LCP family protein [Paenibacillus sp. FSL M8-0334]|uniref:LCP family glycopolymer transferase n=1 Tax=Paenibacillus sp. FSL M8-0334 TaxID=2921623 RepID=UPI0030F59850
MTKRTKWLIGTLIALLVLPSSYMTYVYLSIKSTVNEIYEERPRPQMLPEGVQVQDVKGSNAPSAAPKITRKATPFTVLILGVDERPSDSGRSDAMIFMAVDPDKGSVLIFNIPRDTRTDIVGRGTVDKINHAYAFGGVDMSIQTVEHFLKVPVDYYIKVDMEGFADIIDTLGGVTVHNDMEFDYAGFHFGKGEVTLTGEMALAFSRMRFEDPRGDLGRNSRQQEIIKAIMHKAMNVSTAWKLEQILDDIKGSVKTNISFDEMKILVSDYRQKLRQIEQIEIQGHGQRINGIWYYIVNQQEQEQIQSRLYSHMNSGE